MTQLERDTKDLIDAYADATDTNDPAVWDAVTTQFWNDLYLLWKNANHPVKKPRPRPI